MAYQIFNNPVFFALYIAFCVLLFIFVVILILLSARYAIIKGEFWWGVSILFLGLPVALKSGGSLLEKNRL